MKSDRERQISYDITYMWNLKKKVQVNLFTELKDSQIKKTKLWLTGENGEGINCEIGIDTDTLLYVK